jgi:hypothetical protein
VFLPPVVQHGPNCFVSLKIHQPALAFLHLTIKPLSRSLLSRFMPLNVLAGGLTGRFCLSCFPLRICRIKFRVPGIFTRSHFGQYGGHFALHDRETESVASHLNQQKGRPSQGNDSPNCQAHHSGPFT